MGNISDALRRAELERERLRTGPAQGVEPPRADEVPAVVVAPAAAPAGPGLANVVLRARPPQAAAPAPDVPDSPLTAALKSAQSAPTKPPVVRPQQKQAETIVEDYESKQRLNLPQSVVVYHDRSGPIAEQYRKIRQRLMEANPKRDPTALVITSTVAGEGKTVTALNLALSLAEVRANRVLLIDADLHRAALSGLLKMGGDPGLTGLVAVEGDPVKLEEHIRPTPWHNLFLLPAGPTCLPAAAAQVLQRPTAAVVLRQARKLADWVIIDSPAAEAFPDAGILAAHADGVLLAVAMGHTPRERVHQMVRRLRANNVPLRGCVLTRQSV